MSAMPRPTPIAAALAVREYGRSPGSHAHDHAQVLIGLEGVLALEVEGRGLRIGAGDALLVGAGARHDFEAERLRSRCLVLDSVHPLWAGQPMRPRDAGAISALAQYLAATLQQGAPLARLHGPALLLEAWSPASGTPQRPRRRIAWDALSAWVQANLHQPLGLAELAAQVHLSPSQFALRCHEVHGQSPIDWLRSLRLAKARELRALGQPVREVARRTGYRSPSALTAALRRTASP